MTDVETGRGGSRSSRRARAALVSCLLAAALAGGCKPGAPEAKLDDARPVVKSFVASEKEHRNSHGNFWRDRQEVVDPDAAMRHLGVDLTKAAAFEFVLSPSKGGMDPEITVTARAKGDPQTFVRCTYDSAKPEAEPTCEEGGK